MNFFDAQLEKTEGGYVVKCLGAEIPVPAEMAAKLEENLKALGK